MAKLNYVSLYGQVTSDPAISLNEKNEIVQGRFCIKVIRRFFDENKRLEISSPMVITGSPSMASKIVGLKKNDMCYIKGVITTINTTRPWICECGYQNRPKGMHTLVTPLFIDKRESLDDLFSNNSDKDSLIESEGIKKLKEYNEISNVVHVIGTVCNIQPLYTDGRIPVLNFQIASNRRFKVVNSDPETRTDYPWVKVYGEDAVEAAEVLDINSTIMIDGSLFTKIVQKQTHCEHCGEEHTISEFVSEIHPYPHSIEYLHNCNLPESEYVNDISDFTPIEP